MSDHLTVKVEPLGLANLCDGRIAAQFDAALAQVGAALDDEQLAAGRQKLTAKIVIDVEFELRVETGTINVAGKVKVALPERRKVGSSAMLRGGRFLVEPDTQLELLARDGERA